MQTNFARKTAVVVFLLLMGLIVTAITPVHASSERDAATIALEGLSSPYKMYKVIMPHSDLLHEIESDEATFELEELVYLSEIKLFSLSSGENQVLDCDALKNDEMLRLYFREELEECK